MDRKWSAVLRRAEMHLGLVDRRQLIAAELTDRQIERALGGGLLAAVAPGLYRVCGVPQTERMAIAAAVSATGGAASFGTAASLLHLDAPTSTVPIDVTVDVDRAHPRLRRVEVETSVRSFHPVVVHRYIGGGGPVLSIDGVRCTDAAQTVIDLAARLAPDDLGNAFERARRLGLVTPAVLARRFERVDTGNRKGAPAIREVLADARPGVLDSELEARAGRLLVRSPLAEPTRQFWVRVSERQRYRIDFAWPDLLVAVEAEGFEWHGGRAQWKADRRRVAALERLGWRVLVVTWDDVVLRPAETIERIAMALAERSALARVV